MSARLDETMPPDYLDLLDELEPLTLSAAVVLGQMRSLVVDLLELSGPTYSEAIARVPAGP